MFRNKEIQHFTGFYAAITAAAAAAGLFTDIPAAFIVLVFALAALTAFLLFTRKRYDALAAMAEQIDRILHDEEEIFENCCEEGELAILQSEISKMTVRIREQNRALEKEKSHLADSLADIAHQLRTPLTSAGLILSLMRKEADPTERLRLIRETKEIFSNIDWLLTSLLKISRLDAGMITFSKEPCEVHILIDKALSPLQISAELHDINITTDIPEDAVVDCDVRWLAEALTNIIKNCMESAGDGGSIAISCEDNPLFTEIYVRDSGSGFSEKDLPHIFDRFYRSESKAGSSGYGIGLSLSENIVICHDGDIKASNHPEGGALFTIRFPK